MELEKIKDRLNKLLALAESDNKHEAESAARMAAKLMLKYNLSSEPIEERLHEDCFWLKTKNVPIWINQLAAGVEEAVGIFSLCSQGVRVDGVLVSPAVIKARGQKKQVSMFIYLMDFLSKKIERMSKQVMSGAEHRGFSRSFKMKRRASYKIGLAVGVGALLKDAFSNEYNDQNTDRAASGMDLVATNRDLFEHAKKMVEATVSYESKIRTYSVERESYEEGVKDAKSLEVRKPLTSSHV